MLSDLNRPFWTGGLQGQLLIARCRNCGWWNHPAPSVCRVCLSPEVTPEPASGRATLATYTINHHRWSPDASPDPYVIAIVELVEQAGLRQISNIVNCTLPEIRIGMPLTVTFAPLADVAIPLFEPAQ
jgi:uncharacterized OB-fold protein